MIPTFFLISLSMTLLNYLVNVLAYHEVAMGWLIQSLMSVVTYDGNP